MAFVAYKKGISDFTDAVLDPLLQSITIAVDRDTEGAPVVNVSGFSPLRYDDLQSEELSRGASQVAKLKSVRDYLLPVQQNSFPNISLVAEGRDMGTVVFPAAPIKFFVQVDADIRANRRYLQLLAAGLASPELPHAAIAKLKLDILSRDENDQRRDLAPCIPAADAIIFDNGVCSLVEAVDTLSEFVKG